MVAVHAGPPVAVAAYVAASALFRAPHHVAHTLAHAPPATPSHTLNIRSSLIAPWRLSEKRRAVGTQGCLKGPSPARQWSQPRESCPSMLSLCLALLADLLPDSLDSLRTLAGLQQLQEQQQQQPAAAAAAAATARSSGPPPWAGPWQAATDAVRAGGGDSERVSAAVDGNGQLAAKAGQVAASATALPDKCARAPVRDQAVVTLITNNEGYPAGALAVAAALEVLDSKLRRIVLVTEDVTPGIQERRPRLRLRLHLRLRLRLSLDPDREPEPEPETETETETVSDPEPDP